VFFSNKDIANFLCLKCHLYVLGFRGSSPSYFFFNFIRGFLGFPLVAFITRFQVQGEKGLSKYSKGPTANTQPFLRQTALFLKTIIQIY
jgi:1-acyl-sn-glycerol-3-phosphate acyltransferase